MVELRGLQEHFSTLSQSMMKTVGMTVGEIDLADTFLTLSTSSDKMATLNTTTSAFIFLKYCVVLLFILILPTLLQNQLVWAVFSSVFPLCSREAKMHFVLELATA